MFRRRWLTAGLALLLGGGLAAAIPGLAAVGQSSPPVSPNILLSPGQIVSRGAAALVPVQLVCQPGDGANFTVSLSQRSGNRTTEGFAFEGPVICTGQIEILSVPLTPTPKPFVKGPAFGQLSFSDCAGGSCATFTDAKTITLTTK
jgi:hypothetical protein